MTLYRSFLFAPGNHARRAEKALTLAADAVILDLEDAVAVAEKPTARHAVVAALARPHRARCYVRVNAMTTEWSYADLTTVVVPGIDGIVLPKLESADEIKAAEWVLGALERQNGLPQGHVDLMPIIETAAGFTSLETIARAKTRVRRLAFGAGDFDASVDTAAAIEVIEHLDNPRAFVRELVRVTRPGGWIALTTPNQLSLLSVLCLLAKGTFVAFQDGDYPAHRTALLEIDLRRIAAECGLEQIAIEYTRWGRLPFTARHYPQAVAAVAPRRFSDNVALVGRRCA